VVRPRQCWETFRFDRFWIAFASNGPTLEATSSGIKLKVKKLVIKQFEKAQVFLVEPEQDFPLMFVNLHSVTLQ